MKTILKISAVYILQLTFIYGYGGPPPPPPPPRFLSADVSGPVHQFPLFLSDTNRVTLFTQISFFAPSSIDGKAYIRGTNEPEINADNENNLTWQVSNFAFNT